MIFIHSFIIQKFKNSFDSDDIISLVLNMLPYYFTTQFYLLRNQYCLSKKKGKRENCFSCLICEILRKEKPLKGIDHFCFNIGLFFLWSLVLKVWFFYLMVQTCRWLSPFCPGEIILSQTYQQQEALFIFVFLWIIKF